MLEERERIALYALMKIPGMYPARVNAMFAFTDSFREALFVSEKDWIRNGVFKKVSEPGRFDAFRQDPVFLKEAENGYERLPYLKIRMIDYTEPDMPSRLLALTDSPKVLFVKGSLPSEETPAVSIIGSRDCSDYGRMISGFFGRKLSEAGVQIISGMAAGIDTAALEGGLSGTSGCFAVLGSGVNVCYPRSSRTVYNGICRQRGGILSEYCPDEPALGYHFVTRNRLIAALGDALLVMEAREKSGTAITVENALELGREIFALPGRITDPLGFGCNRLIRDGAQALTCPEDVLEYLGITSGAGKSVPKAAAEGMLSTEQKKVLSLLGPDPVHLEEISVKSGFPISQTSAILNSLEITGAARSIGNAYYVKAYR